MATSARRRLAMGLLILLGAAAWVSCTPKQEESKNTLRIPTVAKIKGLDPAFADDLYSGAMVSQAYEGLYQYHYLKRPYELIPHLAEAMPKISADGRTLTIPLKKGVLFQDDPCFKATGGKGRELVAEDVVYSYKRLADPKLMSTGWWLFDGKIVGLNEWRDAAKAGPDYTKPVEGLKVLDRYTLQITLKERSGQFVYFLAMPFALVVPREAVEAYGAEFLNHAVGTGPFRLQEFNGASKIIWVRNPTFRKEFYPTEGEATDQANGLLADAGKPIPFVDKVVVQIFEESQPQWLNFLAGKIDASGIPKDNYSQAIGSDGQLTPELKQKGIVISKSSEVGVTHYSFNMTDPLFAKNKYLRQAISIAFDPKPPIETFYNGRAIAAQGPIPPGITGYDPDFKNPYRQFNLEKAKELLAKAGFPGGKGLPPIEYNTLSDSTSRQFVEYDQKVLGALGIKLKVNTYSWPEFSKAVKTRRGQMWSMAWGGDYPDAENFLQLFYSKNISPGPNDTNYMNPEFDKLYEQALKLQDSPARTQLYKKMVAILVEDCPWIFGVHRIFYDLTQPWTKNFKRHAFEHALTKYYRIDESAKK